MSVASSRHFDSLKPVVVARRRGTKVPNVSPFPPPNNSEICINNRRKNKRQSVFTIFLYPTGIVVSDRTARIILVCASSIMGNASFYLSHSSKGGAKWK